MDLSFDEKLEMAYKLVLALMNYKRTLEDFEKCGENYQTKQGVTIVGDCIVYDKEKIDQIATKCTDDLPIPCLDGECKVNYIECLRDLDKKNKKIKFKKTTTWDFFMPFNPQPAKQDEEKDEDETTTTTPPKLYEEEGGMKKLLKSPSNTTIFFSD